MNISIITSLYNGEKYIGQLLEMYSANRNRLSENIKTEYILINDSPWEEVSIPKEYQQMNVHLYNNECNVGIHQSRINGIKKSSGEYILILDQDDVIDDNYLKSQYEIVKGRDVVVCNGIKELETHDKKIYRNGLKFSLINRMGFYLGAANQIVSPGQCLIRKDVIPEAWLKNPLSQNGSDDLFLWLLLLNNGVRFCKNKEVLYRHKQVGDNPSNDLKAMCESDYEMCEIFHKNGLLGQKEVNKRLRMIRFIEDSGYNQKLTIKLLMKYPDVIIRKAFSYAI